MKILQFSGGKDSLACLLLLKNQLKDILVMWGDPGDSFPETYAQMERAKKICPNFLVVKGNQPEVIKECGYPVDVLPVRNHYVIQKQFQQTRVKLQDFITCCSNSILIKMEAKCKELGATVIYRGQKLCDSQKGPLKDGDIIDGITYIYPIENWTDQQVKEYVKDSEFFLPHYSIANTGLDCMTCTAHLYDNQWKLPYLDKYHTEVGKEVRRRLQIIKIEIDQDMQHLNSLL